MAKYSIVFLISVIFIMGLYLFYQKRSYNNEIVRLYNEIADRQSTLEVQDGLYKKAMTEMKGLMDALTSLQAENDLDKDSIARLKKEIEKMGEELLAANKLVVKWKKAYEAEVAAHQTTDPGGNPDDPSDDRVRVDFEHDFGYIGVNGYTLTNPAYAWVSIQQNRPLVLTLAITQAKDKSWSTYVASSEENFEVDLKLAAVNPYILKRKWYESISLDFSLDFFDGIMSTVDLSYPIGPLNVGAGLWGDTDSVGMHFGVRYSWKPFER